MKLQKNKKGWIHILEAFISIMLVMSVVMIITVQNRPVGNPAEEIGKLQKYTLDYVVNDNLLRGQVLGGYLGGVNDKVKTLVPADYSYLIKSCPYNLTYDDICSLGFIVPGEVYSDETLLFANLTYYDSTSAVKLKLFFWQGGFPDGYTAPDYYIGKPVESCTTDCSISDARCIGEAVHQTCILKADGCYGWSADINCPTDYICTVATGLCTPKIKTAVLDLRFSGTVASLQHNVNIGGIVYPDYYYYTHSRTFTETNNLGVILTQGQICYLDGSCGTKGAVNYRINANNTFVTINNQFFTNLLQNKFTLTYWGVDDNGHAITVVQKMCVTGMTFVENCA